ncbi:MAG: F0F1 ATP synthase subunit B [candidate division Zixibacteria bacterium]|nr:F0F1 ATP synthase subunit B [candidate division Zixibacteria bacterium]
MDIQWQLLLTHSVGFLITLWILKKFAWGPILSLLEERRTKIVDEFKNIDDEKEKAESLSADYESKLKGIDEERRAKLVEAVNEGKQIAEKIKISAHEEAKQLADKNKQELNREYEKAKVQLRDDMVSVTVIAAGKIINEKLDDNKHRQLINNVIDNLEKA